MPVANPPADRHVRRTGDDYAQQFAALLPWGASWPRDDDSVLMRVVSGLAQIFGFVDSRAADLLERESDPRLTIELLSDWERNWGLPDPCYVQAQTIDQRHALLLFKMTLLGGQSRQFFIDMAAWLGYTITITEFAPFMAGVSQCGDTRGMVAWNDTPGSHPYDDPGTDWRWEIGPPEIRFYWIIHVINAPLMWFRASSGQAGVDHHLTIGYQQDLMCLMNRLKPAHTLIVFDFSNLKTGGSMAGTP
jgi:uncharacterized protein YmfQ (DUF2313 family)